jgi:hypothetical protein
MHHLSLAAPGALLQSGCLAPAVLNSGIHHANEAPDPVCLFTVRLAEPLKTIHQFRRGLTATLDLFLDFVEERVEFAVDFEQ